MRENLFRAKKYEKSVFDETDWVYGSLIDSGNHEQVFIYPWLNGASTMPVRQLVYARMEAVNPETVGEFTGKVDKNGTNIFEGDVFQLEDDIVAVVVFSDGCFRLEEYGLCGTWTESGYDECGGGYGIIECEPIDWYFLKDMEVIGNIHDNPELIPC